MDQVLDDIQHVDLDHVDARVRALYVRASLIGMFGNVLLLGAKGLVAWLTGSSAVYADAANSASDVAYSLLMMIGLWLSLQPADPGHPHGHRRIEPLVSLAIGGMMSMAAIEAGRTGASTWLAGAKVIHSNWALSVPLVTVATKGILYLMVKRYGTEASSPALLASARDHLSDVVTSLLAFLGVLGSRVVAPVADPIAALLVVPWILRNAWEVLGQSIHQLIGGAAPPELVEQIVARATSVPDVLAVHQVIIEYVGPQVRVDIHLTMEATRTLSEVHAVSDAVRRRLEALPEVDHAFVHVEPPGVEAHTPKEALIGDKGNGSGRA